MLSRDAVIAQIRTAFRDTAYPGAAFLVGSHEGSEPANAVAPFAALDDWSKAEPSLLDRSADALSFFSEGAFRFFLPAYLIADLQDALRTADPLLHLIHGFSDGTVGIPVAGRTVERKLGKSVLLNPRRYGAMTFHDYARFRFSIFTCEEAQAIVAYLEYKRDTAPHDLFRMEIDAALEDFWRDRAAHAPGHAALAQHLQEEAAFLGDLRRGQG